MPTVFWPQQAKRLANTFVNLILPPICANCKKVGDLICPDCRQAIEWVEAPICSCCGQPTNHEAQTCLDCQKRPLSLQQIRAATLFSEPIATLIHKLKYNNAFALAEPLANLMIQAWNTWRIPVDLVIPIPLHRNRQRDRGYNQSELLARPFSAALGIAIQPDALQRVRHTSPQVNLTAIQRHSNVKNAFQAATPSLVKGRHILLIDDVCTTGATLTAAAGTLLTNGATAVSAYCLARAV